MSNIHHMTLKHRLAPESVFARNWWWQEGFCERLQWFEVCGCYQFCLF